MAHKHRASDSAEWARRLFPVLAGVGGLLIYLLTLNPWVSLLNLGTIGRVAGWFWQFPLDHPLSFLVFSPFQLLPARWVPLAMNSFTAVCAALVLALLARSVALSPQDRTSEQRARERSEFACLSIPAAWIPPALAALACGLQLTFWEHATSATGEMIRLLVFAYIIRALLEFRIDQRQTWLSRSAFLYGAAMADHWLMIAYLPLYIGAIIRLKVWGVLNGRFLRHMMLWSLAGLTLYLALPLLAALRSPAAAAFVGGFKTYLRSQLNDLIHFPWEAILAMGITSVLPLVAISIRWPSRRASSGDDSHLGALISKGLFRSAHAVLLAGMLWLALDPRYSPRHLGFGIPFLTQYYISALVIGYCAGYFLLIATTRTRRTLGRLTFSACLVLITTFAGAMLWRNFDQIRATNGPALREFAHACYSALPPGPSVVLCDDPAQLCLLQAEAESRHGQSSPLLLHAPSLPFAQYRWFLARCFPSRWPSLLPTNHVQKADSIVVRDFLTRLDEQQPLLYVNPSFGACFEWFTPNPEGGFYRLARRSGKNPAAAQAFAGNEAFWQECWTNWPRSIPPQADRQSSLTQLGNGLSRRLHLAPERNHTLTTIAAWRSKCLNDWGVQSQRHEREAEATVWFQRAVDLNPDNLSAHLNLAYLRTRHQAIAARPEKNNVRSQFPALCEKYRDWSQVIRECGAVDEPTFLWEAASGLSSAGQTQQAIEALERCIQLAPDWLTPKLTLAKTFISTGAFARVLPFTEDLQAVQRQPDTSALSQLLYFRATALYGLGRTNEATATVSSFVHNHPDSPEALSAAANLFLLNQQYPLALGVLDRLLKSDPANTELLSNKAIAQMQLQQFDAAITNLNAALALDPSNQVMRLNRAIVNLRAGQTAAARADYLELLPSAPQSWKVLYGLAETSWREQDTNNAIRYYEECLPHIPADLAESQIAAQRLRALKGGGRL